MSIPETTMQKINGALDAEKLPKVTTMTALPPGHVDAPTVTIEGKDGAPDIEVNKHASEWYIAFGQQIADSQVRARLSKALGDLGVTICAHGLYWKEPQAVKADSRKRAPANGDAPTEATPEPAPVVEAAPAPAADPLADAPEVDAKDAPAPEAPPVQDAAPARPIIEIGTLVQSFKLAQPETVRSADREFTDYITKGWRVLTVTSRIDDACATCYRVVTCEREV